jgi:hypothetical protein
MQIAADVAPLGILQQPGEPFTSPQSGHLTWSGLQQRSLPLSWPHLTQRAKESELISFDSVGFSSDLLVFGSVGPSSEDLLQPGPNMTILIIVKPSTNVTKHFRDFIFTSCKIVLAFSCTHYCTQAEREKEQSATKDVTCIKKDLNCS